MKIGLRGGHSKKAQGAVGLVNEYEQMQKFYTHVSKLLTEYGHTVVDCNSNGATSSEELKEGVTKANKANVDLFISLHMNAFDGKANGTECIVYSESSKSYYEMKNIKAPNIIFEICFCDSKTDVDIYNKYSWEQLTHKLCNAIDNNIPNASEEKKAYIVTKYLPHAYEGYDGVDIRAIIDKYFDGVKCYVRGDENGVWIESEYMSLSRCNQLKVSMELLFYDVIIQC